MAPVLWIMHTGLPTLLLFLQAVCQESVAMNAAAAAQEALKLLHSHVVQGEIGAPFSAPLSCFNQHRRCSFAAANEHL